MLEVIELAGHRAESAHLPKQPLINFDTCTFVRRIELSGLAAEILQNCTGLKDGNGTTARPLGIDDRRHAVVRSDLQEIGIELLALRYVHRLQDIRQTALFEHDRDFETVRCGPVIKLNRLCLFRDFLRGYFRFFGLTPLCNSPLFTARHVVLHVQLCSGNNLPDLVLMIELRNWCGPQISFDCTIVTCNLCGLCCKPGCVIETDGPGPRLKAIKGKERHVQSYDCYPARCRITRGSRAATLFCRGRAAREPVREGCQNEKRAKRRPARRAWTREEMRSGMERNEGRRQD